MVCAVGFEVKFVCRAKHTKKNKQQRELSFSDTIHYCHALLFLFYYLHLANRKFKKFESFVQQGRHDDKTGNMTLLRISVITFEFRGQP